ncbi:Proton-dependent oligopeptide transporter family [Macleaya cordata]|uniref:Proton-dependent oligopeptide transporter family n=1 Tax=Macleaya cordata TaxID=56857 RepID=A0A200QH17_MACCD|nr:Proton-dependent oligopeptide transporter family [Macleaya cordata]
MMSSPRAQEIERCWCFIFKPNIQVQPGNSFFFLTCLCVYFEDRVVIRNLRNGYHLVYGISSRENFWVLKKTSTSPPLRPEEVVGASAYGMDSREIKSPEEFTETPARLERSSDSLQRKKLGIYFVESDDRRTAIGGGYIAGGTTPVNIHGKPITNLSKTGGWVAAFFIFGNEMAERMAYFGLSVNMVAFMFYVMHRPFSSSADAVNIFLGISQASSVLGGFLADAYLGRYWTIAIFSTIYLAGLTGITLCATMNIFVPNQDECNQLSLLLGHCEQAKPWQMMYLYAVLYITGFGAAGIRPCVSSFGADQFDENSRDYKSHLDRFFNFFYLCVTIGAIVAFTMIVYIQMKHGWGSAFGSLAIAMGVSNVVFFIGTPLYRHRLPGGSPLTRVAQVLVAAYRKRHKSFSSSELVGLYEISGKHSAIKGSGKIAHSDDFRCLDKAALQLKEDGADPSPWRLCTVTQVEEVKILLRLLPIPACTIMLSVILTEFLTLSVQQVYTMNTHMGHLKLPVTCMPVFPGLSIFLILSLYYSTFVPLSRRITGHPHGASQLQRVGIGLAVSILSVAWAAIFERYRRNYAIKNGYEASFLTAMPNLTAYWLLIQYCLIGIAEVFCIVGLLEFLYQEAPDAMRSIGSAYAAVAGGLGCFVATILNSIIKSVTGNEKEGKPSWLSQNINKGRFDYLYWLLTVLSVINFCVFAYSARRYKYRVEQVIVKRGKNEPTMVVNPIRGI